MTESEKFFIEHITLLDEETKFDSSSSRALKSEHFKLIVSMGDSAIRLAMKHIIRFNNSTLILNALVKDSPVMDENFGKHDEITIDWCRWWADINIRKSDESAKHLVPINPLRTYTVDYPTIFNAMGELVYLIEIQYFDIGEGQDVSLVEVVDTKGKTLPCEIVTPLTSPKKGFTSYNCTVTIIE